MCGNVLCHDNLFDEFFRHVANRHCFVKCFELIPSSKLFNSAQVINLHFDSNMDVCNREHLYDRKKHNNATQSTIKVSISFLPPWTLGIMRTNVGLGSYSKC